MKIELLSSITNVIDAVKISISRSVNKKMTLTYFFIGYYIVEHEQSGESRASYSKEILKFLSLELTKIYGKGYSVDNLENMRKFYLAYRSRLPLTISLQKSENFSRIFEDQNNIPFQLGWSHYVLLSRIKDSDERKFYELESIQSNWGIEELKRQFDSSLYERLILSRDKKQVTDLAQKGQIIEKPTDVIKDPYVLEFLGLEGNSTYSETDLETAIINQLEHFMLELGKGFLFAGRQIRFTFDEEHYYVDLVFYNRLLRCFVLIDLKIGKLKHQDLGQMLMYVNYYDRFERNEDENNTIGIIICKDKNDALVEITLPEDNDQIFASKYQLYLPSKKELQQQVLEVVIGRSK